MKKFILALLPIIAFIVVLSCAEKTPDKKASTDEVVSSSEVDLVKAKQLLKTSCYVCHSPTAPENGRLAPPMEAVKRRYMETYPNKAVFIEKLSTFVTAPKEENAIMFGAVQQFNLMAPMPFPEEDLRAIAEYIFTEELEYPEWFDAHYEENHGKGKGAGNGMRRQQRQGQSNN